jgi:Tol biopolymer transport system component
MHDLYLYDLTPGKLRLLNPEPILPADNTDVVWSPDGKKVAFMGVTGDTPESSSIDIFVTDVAGGKPVNLTQSPANDRFPQWSPDGSRIAFVSDRDAIRKSMS